MSESTHRPKTLFPHHHDCCVYLGPYADEKFKYDLYFCTQGGRLPTVLARWGPEAPDYSSGLAFDGQIPELTEAARRARILGLLPPVKEKP